jgi:hypothetical protein
MYTLLGGAVSTLGAGACPGLLWIRLTDKDGESPGQLAAGRTAAASTVICMDFIVFECILVIMCDGKHSRGGQSDDFSRCYDTTVTGKYAAVRLITDIN